jgi:hydrogenase/urease accessory protein HupE
MRCGALLILLIATVVRAHEVQPARATIDINGPRWQLSVRWDLAAHLAGVTAGHINAEDIDKITGASDAELTAKITDADELLQSEIHIELDGQRMPLTPVGAPPPEVLRSAAKATGSAALVTSNFRGDVPANATELAVRFPAELGPVVLTVNVPGFEPFHQLLEPAGYSRPMQIRKPEPVSGWKTLSDYLRGGFEHIIPEGLDHVLFVLGLFLLSARVKPLLMQVTAFTVAHTVTFALAMLNVVRPSPAVIEPLIAASIVVIAVENVFTSRLRWWRPIVVFGFGLLHGMGFAGALREWGVPSGHFTAALVGFNLGVECGQLAVIAAAMVLVGWARSRPWYRAAVVIPGSCAIAAVAMYWTVVRVFG